MSLRWVGITPHRRTGPFTTFPRSVFPSFFCEEATPEGAARWQRESPPERVEDHDMNAPETRLYPSCGSPASRAALDLLSLSPEGRVDLEGLVGP